MFKKPPIISYIVLSSSLSFSHSVPARAEKFLPASFPNVTVTVSGYGVSGSVAAAIHASSSAELPAEDVVSVDSSPLSVHPPAPQAINSASIAAIPFFHKTFIALVSSLFPDSACRTIFLFVIQACIDYNEIIVRGGFHGNIK